MIDLKLLVQDFNEVINQLNKRNMEISFLNKLKEVSINYKEKKIALEELQAQRNAKTKLFGKIKSEGGDIEALKAECDALKINIEVHSKEVEGWEAKLQELAHNIPNIPDSKTPCGKDESENVEIKKVLTPPTFSFKPKEHWELAEINGWIDFERGVKLAKSRFSVFLG
ncbi:MAG: serine--tRNA ligase, partial [Helicobacter sp.]|nr:serine--tRNA ligase [Helicobacter sp.]